MKKFLLSVLLVFLLCGQAFATAHTIGKGDQTIGITTMGDVDWDFFSTTSFPSPPNILGIIIFGSTSDRFVILDGSASGPVLIDETLSSAGTRFLPVGFRCRPYLDYSACTFAGTPTAARMTVVME